MYRVATRFLSHLSLTVSVQIAFSDIGYTCVGVVYAECYKHYGERTHRDVTNVLRNVTDYMQSWNNLDNKYFIFSAIITFGIKITSR